MKHLLLWGFVPAMLATAQPAQAQLAAAPNRALIFSNDSVASGGGNITYQWYRNGEPISGATGANYTLPAELANGTEMIEIVRGAKSSNCDDVHFSNPFLVTFCVTIGGVCWANTNIDKFRIFAERPDMYTRFYQWNRAKAWSTTGAYVDEWDSNPDKSTWTVNPCPAGWRLPTSENFQTLHNAGTTWAAANTRGNEVNGRFYGPNHADSINCRLPNNMTNCVFLPTGGNRLYNNSWLDSNNQVTLGAYWTSTTYSGGITHGYYWFFNSTLSNLDANNKASGYTVRCVQ